MSDICTTWNVARLSAGWKIAGAQLQVGNDLLTAALISLFTDRLAQQDDQIPDGTDDPRGWWGDIAGDPPVGSRLWLISRSKLVPEIALRAKDYCVEAMQWLLDDGIAEAVAVVTEIVHPNRLNIQVTVTRGNKPQLLRFVWVWDQIANPNQAIVPTPRALTTETGAPLMTEDGTIIII